MTTRRRFESATSGARNYWEVAVVRAKVVVRYGRVGSQGREVEKSFESAAAARASAEISIREKTRKGYVEIGAPGAVSTRQVQAAGTSRRKAAAARAPAATRAGSKQASTVEALPRLQAALTGRHPLVAAKLRPGASEAAIGRLQKLAGAGLPASFCEFMRWHNGARDAVSPLDGLKWLDVDGIVTHTRMMREIVEGGYYDAYRPDEWWSRGWVQFADDQSGYGALVLDLHGSFDGRPGQVLWAAAKDATRIVLAPSFDAWLATFTEAVERGYLVEEDGGVSLRLGPQASVLFARLPGYRRCEPRPVEVRCEAAGGLDALARATRGERPAEIPASARWLVAASGARVQHWFVAQVGETVTTWAGEDLARLERTVTKKKDEGAAANDHDDRLRKQLYAGFVLGGAENPRPGDALCALHVGDGSSAECIDLSPDGRTLAIGTTLPEARGANLHLVDIVTGRRQRIHTEQAGRASQTFLHRVAFGPEGAELYYQMNEELRVIPREGGKPRVVAKMNEGPLNPHVSRFQFDSARDRMLCFDGPSPCVRRVGGEHELLLALPPNTKTTEYREGAISPSGELIAVVYQSRGVIYSHDDAKHDTTSEIQIWSVSKQRRVHTLAFEEEYLRQIGFTPDDEGLVLGTYSDVAARELKTGKELWRREVVEWAYSPDGSRLAVAGRGAAAKVLDARTWQGRLVVRGPWAEPRGDIHGVATLFYSLDGKLLVAGNKGGRVFVWAARGLSGRAHQPAARGPKD